jgi:hypothetical protein
MHVRLRQQEFGVVRGLLECKRSAIVTADIEFLIVLTRAVPLLLMLMGSAIGILLVVVLIFKLFGALE